MIYIKKRKGQLEEFDKNKIEVAINKAFLEVDGIADDEVAVGIADRIAAQASLQTDSNPLTVEEIQDLVEMHLGMYGCYDVAKAYIKYRYLHDMARNGYSNLMNLITEKISASNVQNQNANVDEHSFGGRVGEASDLVMKQYALDYCVSEKTKKNHIENRIYIHDLSAYAVGSHNCLSIPFDDLLANGFNTRQTDVRPANSVNTAFQLVAVIFQLQSLQQFGGVSATHIDWTMVPYVRKSFYKHFKDGMKYLDGVETTVSFDPNLEINDYEYRYCNKAYKYAIDMTEREIHQAVEAMYHNLK